MEIKKYTLNEKDFEYFKNQTEYWLDYYSLKNWFVQIDFEKNSDDNNMADCSADIENMVASINLYKTWMGMEPSETNLNNTAQHEVCELLLWEIGEMAAETFSHSVVAKKKHEIINRLTSER